jgi:rSAM/selenodomain-associated transferase 1
MSSEKARMLLVFAKEPLPGRAKTRLAVGVGFARASALAGAFLDDTLEHAARASLASDATLRIVHSPGDGATRAAFEARLRRLGWTQGIELRAQCDSPSLGERLEVAFKDAFETATQVVGVGTDSPDLAVEDYVRGFAALDGAPSVLGPARDGGYWLVGLAGPPSGVFLEPIDWSTARALAHTRAAFERRGLAVTLLDERDDVDDLPALEALAARLRRDPTRAPRTAAILSDAN